MYARVLYFWKLMSLYISEWSHKGKEGVIFLWGKCVTTRSKICWYSLAIVVKNEPWGNIFNVWTYISAPMWQKVKLFRMSYVINPWNKNLFSPTLPSIHNLFNFLTHLRPHWGPKTATACRDHRQNLSELFRFKYDGYFF